MQGLPRNCDVSDRTQVCTSGTGDRLGAQYLTCLAFESFKLLVKICYEIKEGAECNGGVEGKGVGKSHLDVQLHSHLEKFESLGGCWKAWYSYTGPSTPT